MTERGNDFVAFAKRTVASRVSTLGGELERARLDRGVEEVHDLRVAARRTVYALDAFRTMLECRDWLRLRRRAKSILAVGGSVRDRDIAVGLASDAGVGPESGVVESLAAQRETAEANLCTELERKRYGAFADRWTDRIGRIQPNGASATGSGAARGRDTTRCLEWDPAVSCVGNAMLVLPGEAERYLATRRKTCDGDRTPDQLHRLRLEGKRLRYTLELFAEFYGTGLREILAQLKSTQQLLGAISDCDATEELVRKAGLVSAGGASELLRALRAAREQSVLAFLASRHALEGESGAERLWPRVLKEPEAAHVAACP